MKNYKIAIYPYNSEIDPFLEYSYFLQSQYAIKAIIFPKGWGYANKSNNVKNFCAKNLTAYESLKEMDDTINCIFIPEFELTEQFQCDMINNISGVLPNIVKIICAARLTDFNLSKIKELCARTNGKCEFEYRNEMASDFGYDLKISSHNEIFDETLDDIPVPIIAVVGMWEKVDKFYTSLTIRDIFLNNGYKVSQIGSRNYCEIMGFHSFPRFMLNPEIDEVKKVILFNILCI
jgi:peptide maturation system protein (TIGR04066 family)